MKDTVNLISETEEINKKTTKKKNFKETVTGKTVYNFVRSLVFPKSIIIDIFLNYILWSKIYQTKTSNKEYNQPNQTFY